MVKKIIVLCMALVFAAPGVSHGARDMLRVGVAVDAKNLDPQNSVDTFSFAIQRQIYEPLFTVNGRTKQLVSVLVDKWEQLDQQTYRFHLKKGVRFHNGEELTAEDVAFSLKRVTTDSVFAKSRGQYINPNGFKIEGKYTLVMQTNGPVGDFLGSMKHPYASILNKKAVTEAGREYFRTPVGTGPYRLVKWVKGEFTDLEAFPGYHGKKPNFAKMRFVILPESASRTIALETGKVDMINAVPYNDFDRLVKEDKVKVVEAPGLLLLSLGMNTQSPKLKDPRVRLAIEYAINKDVYNQVVYSGHAKTPEGPLPTVSQWYPKEIKQRFPYDPEKAKALLKEAGVTDLTLSLAVISSQDRVDGATLIQNMLSQVGIKVDIQVTENAVFNDKMREGKHELYIATWGMQTNRDAGVYWYALFTTSAIGSTNYTMTRDQQLNDDILKATATVDQEERGRIFQRIWDRINELHPMVYLSIANEVYAGAKNLEGMENFADGKINYLGDLQLK